MDLVTFVIGLCFGFLCGSGFSFILQDFIIYLGIKKFIASFIIDYKEGDEWKTTGSKPRK